MSLTRLVSEKLKAEGNSQYRGIWQWLHIDFPLLMGIMALMMLGLFILYSASNQNLFVLEQQILHIGLAFLVMIIFAQIPPMAYQRWAFWLYTTGVVLLLAVLIVGHIGKGASRWLNLGFIRF